MSIALGFFLKSNLLTYSRLWCQSKKLDLHMYLWSFKLMMTIFGHFKIKIGVFLVIMWLPVLKTVVGISKYDICSIFDRNTAM